MPANEPSGELRRETHAVRAGLRRSQFLETSEAMYLTSGYVYDSAAQAEATFKEEIERYSYSRYANPTVSMFEERLAALEGAEACYATPTGMSAVFAVLGGLCGAGDRIVASRALFGTCYAICAEVLPRWGVETVFVDGTDLEQWRAALSVPTTAVFFETPSNPTMTIVDIAAVAELAHAAGATVVVDNVFGTPLFSSPIAHGADVVVYSSTKHIDGQGRILGGAVLGPEKLLRDVVRPMIRVLGLTLSAFNAWVLVKSLETMDLRLRAQAAGAAQVVQFGDMRITVLAPDPAEVVAKAEARVALARDKAAKKKQQGATGGKAAAPWTATPGGKAKPRAGAKGGPRTGAKTGAKTGESASAQTRKRGNVFAANAEAHRQRRKP